MLHGLFFDSISPVHLVFSVRQSGSLITGLCVGQKLTEIPPALKDTRKGLKKIITFKVYLKRKYPSSRKHSAPLFKKEGLGEI